MRISKYEKKIWHEIDRIAFVSSFFAIILLTTSYFFIESYVVPEKSIQKFLLGIITNLIPVFILFALSYAFLRRIQSIRSKRETDELVTELSQQIISSLKDELTLQRIQLLSNAIPKIENGTGLQSKGEKSSSVRVLFVSANPKETAQLEINREVRTIKDSLRRAKFGGRFELIQELGIRKIDLQAFLLEYQPEILHYSGISINNTLILESTDGTIDSITIDELADVLAIFKDRPKLVFLNCNKMDASVLNNVIDYTIVPQEPVVDSIAIEFSAALYQALGNNMGINAAYQLASTHIQQNGSIYKLESSNNSEPTVLLQNIQ